jgi:hypothetical protein
MVTRRRGAPRGAPSYVVREYVVRSPLHHPVHATAVAVATGGLI